MSDQQRDPIIQKYFDLIKAANPDLKGYFFGDPVRIPASFMPAICGSRRMTSVNYGSSAEDEHSMQLVFTVVSDVRKDISDETQLVPGWNTLFDLIEGRDPATLLLKPNSLLYILRHNFAVQSGLLWTDVRTATKVDYGLVANKRQPGAWSIEAAITTTCTLVQLR